MAHLPKRVRRPPKFLVVNPLNDSESYDAKVISKEEQDERYFRAILPSDESGSGSDSGSSSDEEEEEEEEDEQRDELVVQAAAKVPPIERRPIPKDFQEWYKSVQGH